MVFNIMMNHLNMLSSLVLISHFLLIHFLLKQSKKTQQIVLKIQLLLVLIYSIGYMIMIPGKIPVELSTVAYFIVPLTILFGIKKLKIWAVYSALLSGIIYYSAMILFGTQIYSDYPPYTVYMAIYNHGALLTYSYITLSTTIFYKKDRYIIWIGIIFSILWALALRPLVIVTKRIFIYDVIDAFWAYKYFPDLLVVAVPIFYILFAAFIYFSVNSMYVLNKVINKSQSKNTNKKLVDTI